MYFDFQVNEANFRWFTDLLVEVLNSNNADNNVKEVMYYAINSVVDLWFSVKTIFNISPIVKIKKI